MGIWNALSRRAFVGAGVAGLAAAAMAAPMDSSIDGVHVGLQTFSLRGIRYPELVAAVRQTGIGEIELFSVQIEPSPAEAPDLLKWRETVSLDFYKAIRQKFEQAGVRIYTYNPIMSAGGFMGRGRRGRGGGRGAPDAGAMLRRMEVGPPPSPLSDAQIERLYQCAQALGARTLNAQMALETARRVAPIAAQYKMLTSVEAVNPTLLTQVAALSRWMRLCVDVGDFTRVGLDPMPLVEDHYDQLLAVNLKDGKRLGASVPFGAGDAPIKQVLRLLAKKKGSVRAYIDCDYPGTGTSVAEVRTCLDYVRACLG